MKVSAFNNGQTQSNSQNFNSRAIEVRSVLGGTIIEPGEHGLAGQCIGSFKDGLACVGILNKGVDCAEHAGDFLVAAGVKDTNEAQGMYQRVKTLLDMARTTDGEPILVDSAFRRII